MNKFDIMALTLLFIASFYLWTLPVQNDSRPFGEGDSAWHFAIGDYIASSDKPIWRLPFYIGQWYYNFNPELGVNAPHYPPPNHYNQALVQISGGERYGPVFIYRAITSFMGVFSVYFLISRLFGTVPAIAASTGLVFSLREYMTYVWGQQPTLISVVIAPVAFYAFYRYLDSYYKRENKVAYLYVTILLLGSQYLLHIQGFFLSFLTLSAFGFLMWIKHLGPVIQKPKRLTIAGLLPAVLPFLSAIASKLPFVREKPKHLAFCVSLFLIISLPFLMVYLGTGSVGVSEPENRIARMLDWGIDHSATPGNYPSDFHRFSTQYPVILAPLLFLGIVFLLIRRRNRDMLILGWMIGVYLVLHADVFLGTSPARSARMLIAEPALFYSLIAIGGMFIFSVFNSFFSMPSNVKSTAKFAVAAFIILIIFQANAGAARDTLSGVYPGIGRITDVQTAASEWMTLNLPENSYVYYVPIGSDFKIGPWQYPKMRWMLATSQRHVASFTGTFANNTHAADSPSYYLFDYSDLTIINSVPNNGQWLARQKAALLLDFEAQNFNISDALYDENNIRVYKVEIQDIR